MRRAERLFARKGYSGTSIRELARVSGVRMFTIQHHFGSKQGLYEEIVRGWDREAEELVSRVVAAAPNPSAVVSRVVEELFDFFLANRSRVVLNARAALGEGLPERDTAGDHNWVRVIASSAAAHNLRTALDLRLLLITVEGILHNHILARAHYEQLFGRDVTAPEVAAAVKEHLKRVVLALLSARAPAPAPRTGHRNSGDTSDSGRRKKGRWGGLP